METFLTRWGKRRFSPPWGGLAAVVAVVVVGLFAAGHFFGGTAAPFEDQSAVIRIGVLAKRGPEQCLQMWSPTAEYLSDRIPGKAFEIVPLDFGQISSFVQQAIPSVLSSRQVRISLPTY